MTYGAQFYGYFIPDVAAVGIDITLVIAFIWLLSRYPATLRAYVWHLRQVPRIIREIDWPMLREDMRNGRLLL